MNTAGDGQNLLEFDMKKIPPKNKPMWNWWAVNSEWSNNRGTKNVLSKKFQIFSTIMCRKYMYLFTDQALLEKYLQSFVELIFSQRENSTLFTSVYNFEKYIGIRECVRAGARTRRSLGHHLLHLLILRLLVLCAPADFEAQSSLL